MTPGAAAHRKPTGSMPQPWRSWREGRPVRKVIVDPSAASFIELLRREGWNVEKADNDVLAGIRTTAELLRKGKLVICEPCADAIREFALYCWDERAEGDRVKKVHDHAMDDIRYFAVLGGGRGEGCSFQRDMGGAGPVLSGRRQGGGPRPPAFGQPSFRKKGK